jgi:hypothetical protein
VVARTASHQLRVGDDLDERRPVVRQGPDQGVVELVRSLDADAEGAAEPGVGGEVGVVQRGLPYVVALGPLLLGDLAERAVVQQDLRDV